MGLITRLLSFSRRDTHSAGVVDSGGGVSISAEHFSPPGDDSQPLPDDFAVTVDVQRSSGEVIVGYIDTRNGQTAQPGDKRNYARSAAGDEVCQVWLQNSGRIQISNGPGTLVMAPDGTVTINSVVISPDGAVTVPQSLIVAGDEVANHDHGAGDLLDSGGNPCSGNTADL